jgi:hypothetical protein
MFHTVSPALWALKDKHKRFFFENHSEAVPDLGTHKTFPFGARTKGWDNRKTHFNVFDAFIPCSLQHLGLT